MAIVSSSRPGSPINFSTSLCFVILMLFSLPTGSTNYPQRYLWYCRGFVSERNLVRQSGFTDAFALFRKTAILRHNLLSIPHVMYFGFLTSEKFNAESSFLKSSTLSSQCEFSLPEDLSCIAMHSLEIIRRVSIDLLCFRIF